MSTLYIPLMSRTLDNISGTAQKRVGLQGPPGSGKTWAALTFPNPVVLNFDRGLGAHLGRPDVIEVPFWNPQFVDKVKMRDGLSNPPNRKDALLMWLHSEGQKLSEEQTLILDSNTQIETAYHLQYRINPVTTRSGKVDDFAEWRLKVEWYGELMDELKSLKCNVVYIAHETDDRDKGGELNGRIKPLLTGQFADQLASHFTDYFRCHAFRKPSGDEQYQKFCNFMGVSIVEGRTILASTPTNCASIYCWETISSDMVKHLKTSTMVGAPRFVLANYSSFDKYKRKYEQTTTPSNNKPN